MKNDFKTLNFPPQLACNYLLLKLLLWKEVWELSMLIYFYKYHLHLNKLLEFINHTIMTSVHKPFINVISTLNENIQVFFCKFYASFIFFIKKVVKFLKVKCCFLCKKNYK